MNRYDWTIAREKVWLFSPINAPYFVPKVDEGAIHHAI
jgi:hypothetical protein